MSTSPDTRLDHARQLLGELEGFLARQRDIVTELKRAGLNSEAAEKFLSQLEVDADLQRARLQSLAAEVDELRLLAQAQGQRI